MSAQPDLARVPNYIEHTWLAWARDGEMPAGEAERRLERVARHYGSLYAEPLGRFASVGARTGLALLTRDDERRRWPLWSERGGTCAAYTTAPTGWGELLAASDPTEAAGELALRLRDDPDLVARLNPPLLLGLRDEATEELRICNDFMGTARLYELQAGELRVWSNRLGALPVFAGTAPRVDQRAWSVLAATGWILGEASAVAGVSKVPPASAISVRPGPQGADVARTRSRRALELVSPREMDLERAADAAASAAVGLARDLRANWAGELAIDLSGGGDSRVSAAGAVAAGVDGRFQTVDLEPGEVDLARELLERSPRRLEHVVRASESPREDDGLAERVRAYHLVHDGMLNPHSLVRGPMELPQAGFLPPIVSGHGGELGHGFYYGGGRKLERAEGMNTERLVRKLERAARRKRDAAREEGYEAFRDEATRSLEAGRDLGLAGASLLDWYYLNQRLAYRSGLGARNDRHSACSTPEFVRACFDLTPQQRLRARLRPMLVARLVPEWAEVPIFESASGAPVTRARLWEQPHRVAEIDELVAEPGAWDDVFDPDRVRELWGRSRAGDGRPHDERLLTRIAWRAGFDAHLRELAAAASA